MVTNKATTGQGGRGYGVRLVDFKRENDAWRERLQEECDKLRSISSESLSSEQKERLKNLESLLQKNGIGDTEVLDPLAWMLNRELGGMVNGTALVELLADGTLKPLGTEDDPKFSRARRFAATFGHLIADNQKEVGYDSVELDQEAFKSGDYNHQFAQFSHNWVRALGEYEANEELYKKVLMELLRSSDPKADRILIESQWVRVCRRLVAEKRSYTDSNFPVFVRAYFTEVAGATDGSPFTHVDIKLPDLEAETDQEIQTANLDAMQAIYFSAMLEELKLFQVTDKLVEQYHYGLLPLGRGNAGQELYSYWKDSQDRLTEMERRSLYSRTLGIVGGEEGMGSANRDFQNLWMRFLSAVSTFYRQLKVDSLLRTAIPVGVHQEQVRKAGRDLAANLSLHGYGVAYYAAVELQKHIEAILNTLKQPELLASYGARDVWQLVDQVAALELGGARNSVRYRTMAQSGAVVIRWLSKKQHVFSAYSTGEVLIVDHLLSSAVTSKLPMEDPTDYDLVNAVEQWLAVNGIPDQQVETYSQPYEPPPTTSAPIKIPAAARDVLDAYGIQAGGNGGSLGSRLPDLIQR